jgi:hypothetical protein
MLRTEPAMLSLPFGFPSHDATPHACRWPLAITALTAGDRATGANDATPFRCVGCVHARQLLSALSPDKFFRGGLFVAPTPG